MKALQNTKYNNSCFFSVNGSKCMSVACLFCVIACHNFFVVKYQKHLPIVVFKIIIQQKVVRNLNRGSGKGFLFD